MAVHDWSKVVAGNFHDFHQAWIIAIRDVLNGGILPDGFYAMAEQVSKGPIPDVLAMAADNSPKTNIDTMLLAGCGKALKALENPPQVKYTEQGDVDIYAAKADRVSVRHVSGDLIVAFVEIVSPGNKSSELALDSFVQKLVDALQRGLHLMVIDLHRPRMHDPRGIHAVFWERVQGIAHGVTEEQPYGVSAYCADAAPTAFFEPLGLGDSLPEMPLFLTPDYYVNVPLEQTYTSTWSRVPKRWRDVIEQD
jgi:uncharacterized protein DUF4058